MCIKICVHKLHIFNSRYNKLVTYDNTTCCYQLALSYIFYNYLCIFCFVDRASLYNLVNKTNLVLKFILSIFINLYMFRATVCPPTGEATVFIRHLVLVILCG